MDKTKIIVLDRGEYTTCTVNLQGASVTSWRINNQEQLFVSRQSQSHELSHITGGIQLIFPHFGVSSMDSKLGFARTLRWVLEEGPEVLDSGDVFAVFSLADDFYTRALWGYNFRLLYMVTLCKYKLAFRLCVENLCKSYPLHFHIMQNVLFRYKDNTQDDIVHIEEEEVVPLSGYSNRTYMHVPEEIMLHNMIGGRTLRIRHKMTKDINLWNPKIKKAAPIIHLDNDEYQYFIGVGAGVISDPIRIEPMSCWSALQIFEFIEPIRDMPRAAMVKNFYDWFNGFC